MTSSTPSIPDSLHTSYASSGFAPSTTNISSTAAPPGSISLPGHPLPFNPNVALLVIDVCEAYLTPGSPLYAPDTFSTALHSIETLISYCRDFNFYEAKEASKSTKTTHGTTPQIPIIFTRVLYPTPAAGGNWYAYKLPNALSCFDAGNSLAEFPISSSVVRPHHLSETPISSSLSSSTDQSEHLITKTASSCFFATDLHSLLQSLNITTLIIAGFSTSGCVRSTVTDAMQLGYFPWVVREAVADRHEYPHEANLFDIQSKFGEVVGVEEMMGLIEKLRGVAQGGEGG